MRLIFHNPHANMCGKMVFNWLFNYPHLHRYTYLWEEGLKDPRKKIAFLIDGAQSSFHQVSPFQKTIGRFPFLLRLFTFLEFLIWRKINGIKPSACQVYYNCQKLDPKNDIIFSIGYTSLKSRLDRYDGIVLVHLTHYHHATEEIARYFKRLKHGYLVAENDLTDNKYFRHYFPDVKNIYQLPPGFPDRFKKTTEFRGRINKCFASGSSSVPSASSYVKYFGKGVALNPMRDVVYQNKEHLKDIMEVYIFPHDQAFKELTEIKKTDGFFKKYAKKHLPPFFLKIIFKYQLPYFRFNIVEKYNQYTMFISPEERTGLPSMKMFEGVACGAALVGIDDRMYANIGLKDGVNYIAYQENNLADLRKKLRYYQAHPDELEKIAKYGYELVISRFLPAKMAGTFWGDLEKLSLSFQNGKPHLNCSFIKNSQTN